MTPTPASDQAGRRWATTRPATGMTTGRTIITASTCSRTARGGGFIVYVGLLTLIGLSNALVWAYVAFVQPSLFRREPPREIRAQVLAVMLVLPLVMPVAGLVVAQRLPAWSLAGIGVIALGARILRGRIKHRIEQEWRP